MSWWRLLYLVVAIPGIVLTQTEHWPIWAMVAWVVMAGLLTVLVARLYYGAPFRPCWTYGGLITIQLGGDEASVDFDGVYCWTRSGAQRAADQDRIRTAAQLGEAFPGRHISVETHVKRRYGSQP